MWKSLGDASAYVSLCPLYVSCITKGPVVESPCKRIQCLLRLAVSLKWNHSLLGFSSRLHNKTLSHHVLHCLLTSVFFTSFKFPPHSRGEAKMEWSAVLQMCTSTLADVKRVSVGTNRQEFFISSRSCVTDCAEPRVP